MRIYYVHIEFKIEEETSKMLHLEHIFIDIDSDIDIFVNCNWVDTRWQ